MAFVVRGFEPADLLLGRLESAGEVARRGRLAFVANAMYRDDAPSFHKEPRYACVQFVHMAEFKQTLAKRLGQRVPVTLAVAQLGEAAARSRGRPDRSF